MIAQNIYSIYLDKGLHKRKVFDQIIHIMLKRINLSIYKHQITCYQSASAGVLDEVLDYGSRGPEFESSAGLGNFAGKQMCINSVIWHLLTTLFIKFKANLVCIYIYIYICHNNVIWIQNNGVNYHKKQIIALGVEPRLWKGPKYI